MPAKLFSRILPVAAITAGLLVAAPAADAGKKKGKTVTAKIALGDKRPVKARTAKVRATKAAAAPCENTNVLPSAENLEVVRAAILCLHNQIRAENDLPTLRDNSKLRKAALAHSVLDGQRRLLRSHQPQRRHVRGPHPQRQVREAHRWLDARREPRLGHRRPELPGRRHAGLDGLARATRPTS